MPEQCIKFLVGSTHDVLGTPANKVKWGISTSSACKDCNRGYCNLEHILSSCPAALSSGKYTWRHNQVLNVLAAAVEEALSPNRLCKKKRWISFVKEGASVQNVSLSRCPHGKDWVDRGRSWKVRTARDGVQTVPSEIVETRLRPDIVAWSPEAKIVVLIELTVPWESRLEEAHERKLLKYTDLRLECEARGWECFLYAVEVGCRGYVGKSAGSLLSYLGLRGQERGHVVNELCAAAERASYVILKRFQASE